MFFVVYGNDKRNSVNCLTEAEHIPDAARRAVTGQRGEICPRVVVHNHRLLELHSSSFNYVEAEGPAAVQSGCGASITGLLLLLIKPLHCAVISMTCTGDSFNV